MLGDLIADLILDVVLHPFVKAMDSFVAGVKKRLARIRARFEGGGDDDGDDALAGRYDPTDDRERSTERN